MDADNGKGKNDVQPLKECSSYIDGSSEHRGSSGSPLGGEDEDDEMDVDPGKNNGRHPKAHSGHADVLSGQHQEDKNVHYGLAMDIDNISGQHQVNGSDLGAVNETTWDKYFG